MMDHKEKDVPSFVDTKSPHFRKLLPPNESRLHVCGCRGIHPEQALRVAESAMGVKIGLERIATDHQGFWFSLPWTDVSRLLQRYCFSTMTFRGRQLAIEIRDRRDQESKRGSDGTINL
jgi:hypothetical protein